MAPPTLNEKLVDEIYNYIEINEPLLFKSYDKTRKTQKYDLKTMLSAIVYFLSISSSWKNFNFNEINYTTIYKNFRKLNEYHIFEKAYDDLVNRYMNNPKNKKKFNQICTDTTTIYNKLNEDTVKRNKYFKNKNVAKITLITDVTGTTLNADVVSGNLNDSTIFQNQLDKLPKTLKKKVKSSTLLADSGYDYKLITGRKTFKNYIIPKNPRNTKDEQKLESMKMTDADNKIYKKRICIEHTNQKIKSFRRLNTIYERNINNYKQLLYLALSALILKKL